MSINYSNRLLQAFLVLADCRQFTLAAQRCHLSQSAFSQAIARLEDELGARLFERSTRSVTLTSEGRLFLPKAQGLVQDFNAAVVELRNHAERRQGSVAIAALPSLSAEWLPKVMSEFRSRYPGITAKIFDTDTEGTLRLVRERKVDFSINAASSDEDEFDTEPLFRDRFFLVCRSDNPLALAKQVLLKKLAGADYIHSTRTGSMWRQLYPLMRNVAVRDTGIEVAYLSTLAGLIAEGFGISIVNGVSLVYFKRTGLVAVPIADRGLAYQVQLVKSRGHGLSAAARGLRELVVADGVNLQTIPKHR